MTRVVGINIPHRTRRETREAHRKRSTYDARLAMRLAGPDGVVAAVEIDRENDEPFEQAAHRANKRVVFRNRKTQVAFPAKWHSFTRLQRTLTDALAGINPARDLNGVANCEQRTIYWSAHLPNGKHKRGKVARLWRLAQWNRYERRAGRKIARWNARGWHQVVTGDINDRHGINLHPAQVKVVHAGLMQMYAIPAPGHVVKVARDHATRSNKGDHPVVVADITFEKGPA